MNLGFVIVGVLVALAGLGLVASAVRNRGDGDSPGNNAMLIGGTMAAAFGIILAGFIFPVAWIISLFDGNTAVYAVPNNGGWYDFGYFVGIVFIGVGARKTRVVYKERVIDVKARRVEEMEP